MATIYITKQGAVLRKIGERLKVTYRSDVLLDMPLIHVSQVVIFGKASITAATVAILLDNAIEVSYLTQRGRFVGRLMPAAAKNVILRRAQYKAAFDDKQTLALAKGFVSGKLANMRTLLMRAAREQKSAVREQKSAVREQKSAVREQKSAAREQKSSEQEQAAKALAKAADQLKAALKRTQKARTLDQLRGHEGEGSAAYFSVLNHLVKTADFSFSKRVRRPPTDPVNALLSFGYTLLTTDLFGAVNVVGLDPYLGYLHAERYGRPSLPLDLMEEFRPIVVDSVVLTCLNKGIVTRDDFTEGVGKVCALTDAGRERFLEQYEARKQTEFIHPVLKQTMTYQRCFEQQARFLGKTLQGELKTYPPLVVK